MNAELSTSSGVLQIILLQVNHISSLQFQSHDHIKPRLLGHWGTCPGLVLIYAHLNRIIRNTGLDTLLVVGPGTFHILAFISFLTFTSGHGAPAILSCLWLEDSLSTFFPEYTRDRTGLHKLITLFSVPGGFPRSLVLSSLSSQLTILQTHQCPDTRRNPRRRRVRLRTQCCLWRCHGQPRPCRMLRRGRR